MVYHNDAVARKRKLSPQQRLIFHQTESGTTMDELHVWLTRQFDERLVEPNSALGKAVAYLLVSSYNQFSSTYGKRTYGSSSLAMCIYQLSFTSFD